MRSLQGFAVFAAFAVICPSTGCVNHRPLAATRPSAISPGVIEPVDEGDLAHSEIQTVAETEVVEEPQTTEDRRDDRWAGQQVLSLDVLIAEVQFRNPSAQAAQAAWAAAIERYPQAVSLDDPMLQSMFAPASFASNQSQSSYYLGFAQRIPWHGKRQLKGQMAQWEANAVALDADEVKLRLAGAARLAFYDYYLAQRELELNEKNVEVMIEFRSAAKSRYEANQVSQQDLSAADLELAKLKQQRLSLEQSQQIATARINTLLHERPDQPLPAPPKQLSLFSELPVVSELRDLASRHRPELSALSARIQAEQSAVALACKEYYPDFEVMGRYDAFWTDHQQRPQVGLNMNVPLRRDRRSAAVREAQFKVTKLTAEYAQLEDSIHEQVQIAHARTEASEKSVALFKSSILPAAENNLETGRAAYVAGSIDFLRLMEARRQYIDEQINYERTLTAFHRSHSELESAVGIALNGAAAH